MNNKENLFVRNYISKTSAGSFLQKYIKNHPYFINKDNKTQEIYDTFSLEIAQNNGYPVNTLSSLPPMIFFDVVSEGISKGELYLNMLLAVEKDNNLLVKYQDRINKEKPTSLTQHYNILNQVLNNTN